MSKKIKDATSVKRIKSGKAARRISQQEFKKAINAEQIEDVHGKDYEPVSFLELHQRMSSEIKSTGGRPGRVDATSRRKVPMTEQEWHDLEDIASALAQFGIKASPGQVASFLLESSTQKLKAEIDAIEADANSIIEAAEHSDRSIEELKPIADNLLRKMKIKRLERSLQELKIAKR